MNTTNYKKIISLAPVLILCAILLPQIAFAADRYWVGGTGSWSSTAQWAETSGGGSGASVPSAADNCIFDSASNATAYTVTVDTDATCLDLTFAAPASGTISLAGSATTTVSGNLSMLSGMTNSYTGTVVFNATTTGKTITTNTVSLENSSVTFNGAGGAWTFADTATTSSFTITQGTVTAPTNLSIGGSYSNSGTFNSGSGTVTFTSPLYQYIAGIDASGSIGADTGNSATNAVVVSGNYAYVASAGSATLCSSSAGSGIGCELKIFDISNPAAPTYVTGVDASGAIATGTASANFTSVFVSGNYAYVTSAGNATLCSSSADSGIGCELKIFDISNPAAPTYVAGIDVTTAIGLGTGNLGLNNVHVSGNYAYVSSAASPTACSSSASSGIGCELKIFDISNPAAPTYVAGIDASASVGSGTGGIAANDVAISGDYMYAVFSASATGCNVAAGCELKIFNIANPAAPTFVIGVDSSAFLSVGTGAIDFKSVAISGNYLYVVGSSNITACNKSVGGASGCEFQVYDISNPAVPFLAAAIDASGTPGAGSIGGASLNSISISGDYAYIASSGNSTACKLDPYSAIGCELKIFNISNPLAPLYFAGIDSSGLGSGVGSVAFNSVYISGNYVYVGAAGNATACSSTAGSAIGCEFKVVQYRAATPATLSGTLDGVSSFNNIHFALATAYQINNPVSAVNFIADGYVRIPVAISVDRDYYGTSLIDFTDGTLTMTNSAAERTVPLPVAVAGIDASGYTNQGVYGLSAVSVAVSGNYLYAQSQSSSAPCTITAGDALGCELKIFDISDPAAPVYIAGIDATGSTNSGTGAISGNGVFVSGNYAYVAQSGNSTACSSVAGSAIGCELQIFDVSNPAAPTLVVGVDASGSVDSGTTAGSFYNSYISGNYAYIAANGGSTACSSVAGSAGGCEFLIFDVSNPAVPSLLAGVDASGTVGSGTTQNSIFNVFVSGNYAYAVANTSSTACSGDVGSAYGCEVKIFDISSSTAPLYVAGMDASGSVNSGTAGSYALTGIYVSGNYAYTANAQNATECSGTAGSAIGCEIKIFDVSTPTAPTYVAGIDSSGLINEGTASAALRRVSVTGNYLYASGTGNTAPCTSEAGSAIGCELQIYDISNPVAPFYVSGADTSGSTGLVTGRGIIGSSGNDVAVSGDYAYLARSISSTDCGALDSQTGCEVIVFDLKPTAVITGGSLGSLSVVGATTTTLLAPATLSGTFQNSSIFDAQGAGSLSVADDFNNTGTAYAPLTLTFGGDYANTGTAVMGSAVATAFNGSTAQALSGSMTGTSAFGSMTFSGAGVKTFSGNASTTGFTIESGSTVSAPALLSIDGAYQNGGTFNAEDGNIFFTGEFGGMIQFGIDASGTVGSGTGSNTFNDIAVSGDYAYVVNSTSATACSSVAGSAIGCELKIFDISSSTAPTYVAGIDASGTVGSGTGGNTFNEIAVSGNYAYIVSAANATACSSVAGSAIGCEFKIFDISSSTAPTYLAGIDASGTVGSGTGSVAFNGITVSGNYAYIVSAASVTDCSSVAGSAIGCELKIFDISSSTAPVYVAGIDASGTVGSGTGSLIFNGITVSGNYLYAVNSSNITDCSSVAGSAIGCELQIFDISSSTAPTYLAGIDATGTVGSGTGSNAFNDITVSGDYAYVTTAFNATNCSSVAGSATGCELKIFDISSSTAPVYVAGIDASGTVGSGTGSLSFNSTFVSDNYLYIASEGSSGICSNTLGVALGCELKIFDISSSTAPTYLTGIDSTGTVGSGVGAILGFFNITVSGNYVYTVSTGNNTTCGSAAGSAWGCEFKGFRIPQTIAGNLTTGNALHGADITGRYIFSAQASTTNLIIGNEGSLIAPTLLDIAGNYANEGAFTAGTGTVYLSGNTTQTLSGTLDGTNALYNLTVSNTASSILFTATTSVTNIFTMLPSTSAQFLAGATSTFQQIDWQGTSGNSISLTSTESGSSWGIAVPGSRTLSYVNVGDSNACSGESDLDGGEGSVNLGNNFCWTLAITFVDGEAGEAVGGAAPAGQGTVSGGSESSGIDIGGLPGFFAPTNSGSASGFSTGWTSLTNAYLSDNSRASATTQAASDFYGFGFNIPSGNQITGIAIRIEGSASTAAGTVSAELSWDTGVSTTTSNLATSAFSTSDDVYALGSESTLWGRSWLPAEFSDANFRLRLIGVPSNNSVFLDAIQVRVYHQASGSSGDGGGGEI